MKLPSPIAINYLLKAGYEDAIFSCPGCNRNGIAYLRPDVQLPLRCVCGHEVLLTPAPSVEEE